MQIKYGLVHNSIDVTSICFAFLKKDTIITIPATEEARVKYFNDPFPGTLKSIFVINHGIPVKYDYMYTIFIDIEKKEVSSKISDIFYIHSVLKLNYGSFMEELQEQKIITKFLTGNEKVLELGGNIGGNSLIISYILEQKNNNDNNFVSLESDEKKFLRMKENRGLNNMNFHIENSELSGKNQEIINTITYENLTKKYNINFDTLVINCGGNSFYNILKDMPEILRDIKTIVMKNDYNDMTQKLFVDEILKNNNFKIINTEKGGWGPCSNFFFQVWAKK